MLRPTLYYGRGRLVTLPIEAENGTMQYQATVHGRLVFPDEMPDINQRHNKLIFNRERIDNDDRK